MLQRLSEVRFKMASRDGLRTLAFRGGTTVFGFLIIIFGTKGVTYSKDSGKFYCPACDTRRTYALKRVRRFFSLYFIPVIPLDLVGEYVECQTCRGTWRADVLQVGVGMERSATDVEAEFAKTLRRVMIMMMLADGDVDEEEVRTVSEFFSSFSSDGTSPDAIRAEAEEVRRSGEAIEDYLAGARVYLNDQGKEMVVRAAMMVAAADERLDESEGALLGRIAESLEMSPAHFRGVLAEMTEGVPESDTPRQLP